MNRSQRKIILFGLGLSVYALMIATVFSLLNEAGGSQQPSSAIPVADSLLDLEGFKAAWATKDPADGLSAVLVPLGPNDVFLPGLQALWGVFQKPAASDAATIEDGEFDGLQVVGNAIDFSKTAVAELFLSGSAKQVFRQGDKLLVLNSQGKVQVINCANPREPELSGVLPFGVLPFKRVKHMAMRGALAYLLIGQLDSQNSLLVVADLGNPLKPRELSRFRLPANTLLFYLDGQQLVAYAETTSKETPFIYLYELLEDYSLSLLGSAPCPPLKNGFIRYGKYLIAPGLRAGMHVYDFSDPLHPASAGFLELPGSIRHMVRYGQTVLALDSLNQLFLIDLRDPAQPVLSATLKGAEYAAFLLGYGGYTYYFTSQGYLQVYDSPLSEAALKPVNRAGALSGELLPLQGDSGFILLGSASGMLPEGVDSVMPLASGAAVIDSVSWQGGVATLQSNGLVRFVHNNPSPGMPGHLQLPAGQRWLAAGQDRLYVGGTSTVSILAIGNESQQLTLTGEFDLAGTDSWDGLVVEQTLYIAAGKAGLLYYALDLPDKPLAAGSLMLPPHLASRTDVRQLTSPGEGRLLAAAGRVGLLDGRIDDAGRFQVSALFALPAPVTAVAVINQLCLVATEDDVRVVDLRDDHSLQVLGEIAIPGVTRLVAAPPGYWAGLVPGTGWSVFHAPRILASAEVKSLAHANKTAQESAQHLYRLNLFNDHYVKTVPGVIHFPAMTENTRRGAGDDGQ